MTKQTKEALVRSELEVLAVLRERLNKAITLYDINDEDIANLIAFDKIKALANENREVIALIIKHEEYLSEMLSLEVDQD